MFSTILRQHLVAALLQIAARFMAEIAKRPCTKDQP